MKKKHLFNVALILFFTSVGHSQRLTWSLKINNFGFVGDGVPINGYVRIKPVTTSWTEVINSSSEFPELPVVKQYYEIDKLERTTIDQASYDFLDRVVLSLRYDHMEKWFVGIERNTAGIDWYTKYQGFNRSEATGTLPQEFRGQMEIYTETEYFINTYFGKYLGKSVFGQPFLLGGVTVTAVNRYDSDKNNETEYLAPLFRFGYGQRFQNVMASFIIDRTIQPIHTYRGAPKVHLTIMAFTVQVDLG